MLVEPEHFPPLHTESNEFNIYQAYKTLKTLRPIILLLDLVYILFVWKGVKYLTYLKLNRTVLRYISIGWNGFNAVTSIYIFVALMPEFLTSLSRGYYYTVCNQGTFYSNRNSGYAMYLFCLSKIWELGDTVLLALRGRQIIFLHSFHHAIVMIQVCFTYYTAGSMARLGTVMNSFVHCLMYTYFAFQNAYPQIRCFAPVITMLQMSQFLVACIGMISLIIYVLCGLTCNTYYPAVLFHFAVYTAFLVLFLKFYYTSYVAKSEIRMEKPLEVKEALNSKGTLDRIQGKKHLA